MRFRQLYRVITIVILSVSANICMASDPFSELDAAVSVQKYKVNNEDSDFEAYKKAEKENFQSYIKKVQEEFKAYRQINELVVANYMKDLSLVWNKPEISSQKRWIIYEKDIKGKTVIDFDGSEIQFLWPEGAGSPLDEESVRARLEELLRLTRKQAFENDVVAQRIEFLGRQKLETFEIGQVSDKPILWAYIFGNTDIDEIAMRRLIKQYMNDRKKLQYERSGQKIIGWVFPLIPVNHVSKENLEKSSPSEVNVSPALSGTICIKP